MDEAILWSLATAPRKLHGRILPCPLSEPSVSAHELEDASSELFPPLALQRAAAPGSEPKICSHRRIVAAGRFVKFRGTGHTHAPSCQIGAIPSVPDTSAAAAVVLLPVS